MNNFSNKKIYRRWARFYDKLFGSSFINKQREAEISMLGLIPGDKVLFIGIGTGEDLRFVPQGVSVIGVDITEEMLNVAKVKAQERGLKDWEIFNMDGQNLEFEGNQFDFVVLNLILSVIPDGHKCLQEALRVLKPNGMVAIFDKFLDEDKNPTFLRRTLNSVTMNLGTDINRRFSDISKDSNFRIIDEKESILDGMYKIILLQKTE